MLLLNGKEFNTSAPAVGQELQFNHYTESIQRIRSRYSKQGMNDAVTLIMRKERKQNTRGEYEQVPPVKIPAKAYCRIQFAKKDERDADRLGGTEEWAFTKERPLRKNDRYEPNPIDITLNYAEAFSLKNDIDLLYFLLYKSPHVYHTDAVVQGKPKKGEFIIDDAEAKATERLFRERQEVELKAQIMASDNKYPLHNDQEMRKVAQAWGIGDAMNEVISADMIRLTLYDSVIKEQKAKEKSEDGSGKGIKEFYDLINQGDAVHIRSLIGFAISKKYVKLDQRSGAWVYDSDGQEIVNVPPRERGENRSFDYLYHYLTNELNAKQLDMFKREVVTEGYLKGLSYEDLKWWGRDAGFNLRGKSGEVLARDVAAFWNGEPIEAGEPEETEDAHI